MPVIAVRESGEKEESRALDAVNAGPARLEELIVTATKRAKSVRDIPGSIDAFSGGSV